MANPKWELSYFFSYGKNGMKTWRNDLSNGMEKLARGWKIGKKWKKTPKSSGHLLPRSLTAPPPEKRLLTHKKRNEKDRLPTSNHPFSTGKLLITTIEKNHGNSEIPSFYMEKSARKTVTTAGFSHSKHPSSSRAPRYWSCTSPWRKKSHRDLMGVRCSTTPHHVATLCSEKK